MKLDSLKLLYIRRGRNTGQRFSNKEMVK